MDGSTLAPQLAQPLTLTVALPEAFVSRIAAAVATELGSRGDHATASPWMDPSRAADYLNSTSLCR